MTIRNKQELANQISQALNTQGQLVTSLEKASEAREKLATDLADKIDQYVQYQIGTRLAGILRAINASSLDGTPVPLIASQEFDIFTRTR